MYCTKRIGENISLKVRRECSLLREQFLEYYFLGQNLYYVEGDTLHIIQSKMRYGIMDHSLFTHWVFDEQWLSNDDMLSMLEEELMSVQKFTLPSVFLAECNERKKRYQSLYF